MTEAELKRNKRDSIQNLKILRATLSGTDSYEIYDNIINEKIKRLRKIIKGELKEIFKRQYSANCFDFNKTLDYFEKLEEDELFKILPFCKTKGTFLKKDINIKLRNYLWYEYQESLF